jgi:uncharacterized protein
MSDRQVPGGSGLMFPGTALPCPDPIVTPETEPYWAGAHDNVLRLLRCRRCDAVIWYPRSFCPECSSVDVVWFDASGLGTIYSFTIVRRQDSRFEAHEPYLLAYVDLEEGPRMLANIVDCGQNHVAVGSRVHVTFWPTESGYAIPRFTLVKSD